MTTPKKAAAAILAPTKAAAILAPTKKESVKKTVEKVKKVIPLLGFMVVLFAAIVYIVFTTTYNHSNTAKLQTELKTTKEALQICQKNLSNFNNVKERDIAAIISYVHTYHKRISTTVAKEIAKHATELSQKRGLALPLIIGIMEVESAFNPSAVSKAGARGLMQVRHSVWKTKLSETLQMEDRFELHEIDKGIEAGVIVFNHYLEQSEQDISKALYLYVGKDRTYATSVYEMMGRFVLYKASMSVPAVPAVEVKTEPVPVVETKTEVEINE